MAPDEKHALLRRYSEGRAGTRQTIEAVGAQDYADLIIALVAADLPFPEAPTSAAHAANIARASAILQPRLRHGR